MTAGFTADEVRGLVASAAIADRLAASVLTVDIKETISQRDREIMAMAMRFVAESIRGVIARGARQ